MFRSWQRFVNFQVMKNMMREHGFKMRPSGTELWLRLSPYSGASLYQLTQLRQLHCSPLYLRKKRKAQGVRRLFPVPLERCVETSIIKEFWKAWSVVSTDPVHSTKPFYHESHFTEFLLGEFNL